MQEQDIINTFKIKKLLTIDEFAEIKGISKRSAKTVIKALYNKGVLDKVKADKNGEEIEYYFLTENSKDVKMVLSNKVSNNIGNFYKDLMNMLNKEVIVYLTDGNKHKGILRSFEKNHISITLKEGDNLYFIRGSVIMKIECKLSEG